MERSAWWQHGVIYQIYPRSFQDSNGDGVGDLRGIVAKLPYVADLGVDAIWLSPIFTSPMADCGYDVADYTDIDPLFGTMDDFDRLLEVSHGLGLRVLLDFVPNHTSDLHPWFQESRKSRTSSKRDWYIWRDPAPDGGAPTNWTSQFGGPGWSLDPATGQYYYHAFLKEQPDLNWRNPEVREAMAEVLRFWLRRGVDGFRVDVISHLIKDDEFRDNPVDPDGTDKPPHERQFPLYTVDRPEVHDVIAGLRRVVDEFTDRMLIGEVHLPLARLAAYYGAEMRGLHLPFNFSLIRTPWKARRIAALIDEYEAALPASGWPNWVLGNHDCPRVASRIGVAQARNAAMLLLTLRGTPTMYYGDELGMTQGDVPPDRVRDCYEKNVPGLGLGRDGCRTPVRWTRRQNGGFSSGEPWLPIDFSIPDVDSQTRDPGSSLSFHKALLRLRRSHAALLSGTLATLPATDDLLSYLRESDSERILVALNFGSRPARLDLSPHTERARLLLTTTGRAGDEISGAVMVPANDGYVIDLTPAGQEHQNDGSR